MSKREAERRRRAAQDRFRESQERKQERERLERGPVIVGNLPPPVPNGEQKPAVGKLDAY